MLSTVSPLPSPLPSRTERIGYPPTPEVELEFHQISAALLRRRHILLAFTLLGLLGGLFVALTATRTYSATATVEFAPPSSREIGLDDSSTNTGELSTLELLNTELKTQQSEITSDGTALAVIEQLHLDTQAPFAIPADLSPSSPLSQERGLPLDDAPFQRERVLKLFASRLNVDVVKGTRLINISYSDNDPRRAAEIANAVVTASIDQTSGRRSSAYSKVSTWLTDQLAALKQRVEDSQRVAEEYENANPRDLAGMTISPSAQSGRVESTDAAQSVPVARLLTLNNELTHAEVARIAKEAIYRVAQSGDAEAVLSIGTSSLIAGESADSSLAPGNGGLSLLQHLREEQVQNNVKIATASTRYGAKNPLMVDLRRQQAAIDTQMGAELGRIRDRAHSDLDLATRAEAGLHAQVDTQQGEVSQWTTKADHLLLLQGEAAASRALYQDLYAKLQESQFVAGIRASRVAVLDPARVPTSPSSPRKRLDLELGIVVGAVLGIIVAFGLELLDDSLHSTYSVQREMGVPVLASIPRFPGRRMEAEPWVVAEPRSGAAEAYRSFRTAVFANRSQASCQVLLIASALPAEGKATTCLNTAAALAVQGHRVLILNADMRRTQAVEPFGDGGAAGLSECLIGKVTVAQAIRPCGDVRNLFILPAGSPSEHAGELLSSNHFAKLLFELRSGFDYILIDSPPALLFADTRILMANADAYVLVVKASRTPKRELRRAMEELYGSSASFLGVLFNGSGAKVRRYGRFGYGV